MAYDSSSRTGETLPPVAFIGELFTKPIVAWTPILEGMHTWSRSVTAANASLQKEWLGFVERRLQQDTALPRRLNACKAPDEAWQIYTEFLQAAADDYRNEYTELAKLSSNFASEALNVMRPVPPDGASDALQSGTLR